MTTKPMSQRQLAAIMFTDIVGYTALMGKDSAKALELVRISKEIQKPIVEKHHGQWLKEMGDGALVKFGTALDAVNCAIEIQELARAKLDGKLRIGIHSGDITIENDDVYGDGVNVASRLESIADPGGIYISESIEKAFQGQTDVQAKYLGEIKLKNVAYGVRIYAVQGVGLPIPEVKGDEELSGHFLAEVQRRGVVRVAISYLVVAMLLIVLLNQVQDWGSSLPTWTVPALITLLSIGFPVALFLAWNYERSPTGFVKTTSEQSWQNPYSVGQRKPFTGTFIIAGLIGIIVLMYFFPRLLSSDQSQLFTESSLEAAVTDKSIAVLPFVNMSNDPDQEYFSDGMMEEILNHLYKIEDLRVPSRTTSMKYKGAKLSAKEIAEEIGVTHILEGSVRKAENRIRITVQLIDAINDRHLWSETYDRYLTDVFAIQSEVAQSVANTLQAEIYPEVKVRIESQPTSSTEAYDLYLMAQSDWRLHTMEGYKRYEELLEKAIQIDPKFADAHAELGFVKSRYSWDGVSSVASPEEAFEGARPYFAKALELDPNNFSAHLFSAWHHLWYKWDFEYAEKKYQTLVELNPNFSWADYLIATGKFKEAVNRAETAVEIDPLSSGGWVQKILSYYFNNQPDESLQTIETILDANFHNPSLMVDIARIYLYLGMHNEVVQITERFFTEYEDIKEAPRPLGNLAIAYYHVGELDKANQILKKLQERSEKTSAGSPSFYVAMIYAQMGEIDTAFEWLDKAYQDHEVEMYWLKVEPPFEPLKSDPRWQEMLDKVGFPK